MSRYWDTKQGRWIYPSPMPSDYFEPNWDEEQKAHNWRNYINDRLRAMWSTFTDEQRAAIAESAQERADCEEWD